MFRCHTIARGIVPKRDLRWMESSEDVDPSEDAVDDGGNTPARVTVETSPSQALDPNTSV